MKLDAGVGVEGDYLGNVGEDRARHVGRHRILTDEMLGAFAVEAPPDEIGRALRERYEGLVERVAIYVPFVPGERDAFWRTVVEGAMSPSGPPR